MINNDKDIKVTFYDAEVGPQRKLSTWVVKKLAALLETGPLGQNVGLKKSFSSSINKYILK